MPEYRVYVIGEDGQIKLRIDLNCADDDLAKEQAKSLAACRTEGSILVSAADGVAD